MKQHIMPKQAKQLTKDEFYRLFPDLVVRDDWANYHHKKITIGKMLEILFDLKIKVYIENSKPASVYDITNKKEYCDEELSNALWEAIINNIKNNA